MWDPSHTFGYRGPKSATPLTLLAAWVQNLPINSKQMIPPRPKMSKFSNTFQKMALLMSTFSTFSKCFVCFSILFLGALGCAELSSIMCSSIISLGYCKSLQLSCVTDRIRKSTTTCISICVHIRTCGFVKRTGDCSGHPFRFSLPEIQRLTILILWILIQLLTQNSATVPFGLWKVVGDFQDNFLRFEQIDNSVRGVAMFESKEPKL